MRKLFFSPVIFLITVTMLFLPDPVQAQSLAPVENISDFFVTFMTGAFARSVAILGLACCGFLAMVGRMPWGAALAVIAGIVLIFGAVTIVDALRAAL